MNYTQQDINLLIRVIPGGKQNAIHAIDIARRLNYPTGGNEVETGGLIRYAIQNGHIILSITRVGYWVSQSKIEIETYIQSLKSRADDTYRRSEELKNTWNILNPNYTII